ncbi:hypothetical protein H8S90_20035 [Olivibacter sp. SDN3]|uniref:hypothetical protein n=1 Tax=Olivibacter sp. SDN3 TaxID=2764720 RepID=UPI0016515348|nr:hypothetical protein [Olivibacter sp. SDN3]QNL49017.1 hypothetical protein H8S90_20035 [Olivibacter sp. SDN3]
MSHSILQDSIPPTLARFAKNKQIPKVIEKNVLEALSYFPELQETHIKFTFKKRIKKSIMQAQPLLGSLIGKKEKRIYKINISALFQLTNTAIPIHQLPDSIMIGWIGHELGHIMDYEQRSTINLIGFGISYVLSNKFVRKAENTADTYAVNNGVGHYIIETKRFILDHADIPQTYKDRIARLYLSPDDIVEQVRELESENL